MEFKCEYIFCDHTLMAVKDFYASDEYDSVGVCFHDYSEEEHALVNCYSSCPKDKVFMIFRDKKTGTYIRLLQSDCRDVKLYPLSDFYNTISELLIKKYKEKHEQ